MDVVGWTGVVFDFFNQNFNGLANCRWLFFLTPFALVDSTFALETNVDNDILVVDFNDASFNDLIHVELTVSVLERTEKELFGVLHRQPIVELCCYRIIFERTDKIAVDHKIGIQFTSDLGGTCYWRFTSSLRIATVSSQVPSQLGVSSLGSPRHREEFYTLRPRELRSVSAAFIYINAIPWSSRNFVRFLGAIQ